MTTARRGRLIFLLLLLPKNCLEVMRVNLATVRAVLHEHDDMPTISQSGAKPAVAALIINNGHG